MKLSSIVSLWAEDFDEHCCCGVLTLGSSDRSHSGIDADRSGQIGKVKFETLTLRYGMQLSRSYRIFI